MKVPALLIAPLKFPPPREPDPPMIRDWLVGMMLIVPLKGFAPVRVIDDPAWVSVPVPEMTPEWV